ncbi:MAG: transcriptional repressor [Phycisphaerae bacterium]|nr:transcriptional repressor [Phycisphaerae bacterium]
MTRARTIDQCLESFERSCREQGIRLTAQRRVIYEAVLRRDDHPTAEEVYRDVAPRLAGVSRATVYRVLEALVQLGVVTRACHPGGGARFDANMDQHHHLVCLQCGRVADIRDKSLDRLSLPDTGSMGFTVVDHHVQIRGLCRDCQASAVGGARGTTPSISSGAAGTRPKGSGPKKDKRKRIS